LENKSIDAVSNGAKKKAWNAIAEVFEKEPSSNNRTSKQLEAKWKSQEST